MHQRIIGNILFSVMGGFDQTLKCFVILTLNNEAGVGDVSVSDLSNLFIAITGPRTD